MSSKNIRLIIVLLVLILTGCLAHVWRALHGYYTAGREYGMIQDLYVKPGNGGTRPDNDGPFIPDAMPDGLYGFPDLDVDADGLAAANPDFVCWLYYKDGNVSYPVVKEHEDAVDSYLHHTFEGNPSNSGCLFIPYDAGNDFTGSNTFVYGHNMKNGSMFGSLKLIYNNPAEYFIEPYFYAWTKGHERIAYRIIAVYVVDRGSGMYAVPYGAQAYREYVSEALKLGSTGNRIPFTDAERQAVDGAQPIVTLSACYGPAGTANRLLVQGVEVFRESY